MQPFELDNKTYVTPRHAAQIIGPSISHKTLRAWAIRGHTPWNLDLDIKRHPVVRHNPNAVTRREKRLVISEASTLLLKRLLSECRLNPNRPMRLTNDELEVLTAASLRLNR
jgi:hypothetical protein